MSKELKESLRMFYLIETINEERDFEPEETRVEHEHGEAKENKEVCDLEMNTYSQRAEA